MNSTCKQFLKIITIITICWSLFIALIFLISYFPSVPSSNSFKSSKGPTESYNTNPPKNSSVGFTQSKKFKYGGSNNNKSVVLSEVKTVLLSMNKQIDELSLIAKMVDKELSNQRYCSAFSISEEALLKIQGLIAMLRKNRDLLKKDPNNNYDELLSQLAAGENIFYEKHQKLAELCKLNLKLNHELSKIFNKQ